MKEQIKERVVKLLKEATGQEVSLKDNLKALNLDEFDFVMLVSDLEEEYNIEIPDEDVRRMYPVDVDFGEKKEYAKVNQLIVYVARKVKEK